MSPRKAQVLSGCCVLSTRGFKTRHHGECNEGIWSYGVIYIEDISRRLSNSTEVPNHYMYIHINVYIYDMIYIYIYVNYVYIHDPVSGVSIGHWIVHTPKSNLASLWMLVLRITICSKWFATVKIIAVILNMDISSGYKKCICI